MEGRRVVGLWLVVCLLWETGAFAGPPAGVGKIGLGEALEKARKDYSQFEFNAARRSLQRKLDQLTRDGMTHEETLSLIPATILLGELFFVLGDIERARRTFEEVVRLAPETALSERRHSPQVRRLFDEAKVVVLSRKKELATLKVTSISPRAKVYLNGALKGKTPLQIKKVMSGLHFLSLTHEGREVVQRVNLKEGETLKVAGDPSELSKTAEVASSIRTEPVSQENFGKSFWKRPAVWIVGGILVAGVGTGAGILMTRGGSGSSVGSDSPGGGGGSGDVPISITGVAALQ